MKAVPESNVTMLCTWDEKAEGRPKLIRSLGADDFEGYPSNWVCLMRDTWEKPQWLF